MRGQRAGLAARGFAFTVMLSTLLPGVALGSGFSVAPVRLDYRAQGQIETLTVRNTSRDETVVQIDAMQWIGDGSPDGLLPSDDLLISPPLFRLAPGDRQLVRVALRTPPDGAVERSYRLVLSEVPGGAGPEATQLRIALRISMPVFVAAQVPVQPVLAWSAVRQQDGQLRLEALNQGNGHAQLTALEVGSSGMKPPAIEQKRLVYLLPGQRRQWLLPADAFSPEPSGDVWIRALSNEDVVFAANVPLAQP